MMLFERISMGMAMTASLMSVLFLGCQPDAADSKTPPLAVEPAEAVTTSADAFTDLLTSMEEIGPVGTTRFKTGLAVFAANPDAVSLLRGRYLATSAADADVRRRIAFLAAQLRRPDVIDVLIDLALNSPEIRRSADGDVRDTAFPIRTNAALGLARNYEARIEGTEKAITAVLARADVETARLLALELFSTDHLEPPWRDILSSRSIPSNFRRLTDEELAQVRAVDPDKEVHQGEDTRRRPRATSVPVEKE